MRQRRIAIVVPPEADIAKARWPGHVSYFSIDQARKTGAVVGLGDKADAKAGADKALDNASADFLTIDSRSITWRDKLCHQERFELPTRVEAAQQDCFGPKVGPVDGVAFSQDMSRREREQYAFTPERQSLGIHDGCFASKNGDVPRAVPEADQKILAGSLDHAEFDLVKPMSEINQRRAQIPGRQ